MCGTLHAQGSCLPSVGFGELSSPPMNANGRGHANLEVWTRGSYPPPMCGRYDAYFEINDYAIALDAAWHGDFTPSANVAPTQPAPILVAAPKREITLAKFGYPETPGPHRAPINARAETVSSLRTFKEAFRERRCLVLAAGFYEWKAGPKGKQPYRFASPEGTPLTFAGIYELVGGTPACFAILTAPAGPTVGEVHTREPLIVPEHLRDEWLTSKTPENTLARVMAERANVLASWAVSTAVNAPKNTGPEVREPIVLGPPRQLSLLDE